MNRDCEKMYEREWIVNKIAKIYPKSKLKLDKNIYTTRECYDILIKTIRNMIKNNKKDFKYTHYYFSKKCKAIFGEKAKYGGKKDENNTKEIALDTFEMWLLEMFSDIQEECDCEACKTERLLFEIDNHIPPEEYPDWDGDDSLMYYLDNYYKDDDYEDDCCPMCGSYDTEETEGCFICHDCSYEDDI